MRAQRLSSKVETFILRQHLVAKASFLLQQVTDGGAIMLSACCCWGAAQWLDAEEVL